MAQKARPYYVGFFGALFPLVRKSIDELDMLKGLRPIPERFRAPLLAMLACDLTAVLIVGLGLGERESWFLRATEPLIRELGGPRYEALLRKLETVRRAWNALHEEWRGLDYDRYFGIGQNIEIKLRNVQRRMNLLRKRSGPLNAARTRLRAQIVTSEAYNDQVRRMVWTGRNIDFGDSSLILLDSGPAYYLRNTDYNWFVAWTQNVQNQMTFEAVPLWLALRDPRNDDLVSEVAEESKPKQNRKDAAAEVFRQQIREGIEEYGLTPMHISPERIEDAWATLRKQDADSLEWLDAKGLRANAYTQRLDRLRRGSNLPRRTGSLDRSWVKDTAKRYVPRNPRANNELVHAELCSCLSQVNPDRYPYRPVFSLDIGQARGERQLARWWARVRAAQVAQAR